MKIVFDSQIFCAQTYGGVSRYFCEVATRIAQSPGIDLKISAPMYINAYIAQGPQNIVSGFPAPNTERFQPETGINYPRRILRGLGLIIGDWMLYAMRPDIVHETYYAPYRLGPRNVRRVLTIYDMIHEKFPACYPHADKTARYKALAAQRADHVICISESTRRDVIDILGLPADKTSVIYLGFDLMKNTDVRDTEVKLPISEPFLLYVGNRGEYKNFSRLLEAYANSPQLKTGFKLVCFGGGALTADELKRMRTLGIDSKRVTQLGGGDHLLTKLYEHASAFIFPSLYEGFGIPPLEAMSHNCPVVCSNTSSIPEIVGDAGEYFDPMDVDSIRQAIERVISSDALRKLLILKGRERLKRFSWDQCAAETLNVYRRLASMDHENA